MGITAAEVRANLAAYRAAAEAAEAYQSRSYTTPNINRSYSQSEIYDPAAADAAGSDEQRGQRVRDLAMRAVETSLYTNPNTDVPATQARIAHLLDTADLPTREDPNHELARQILSTGAPWYRSAFAKLLKSGGNAAVLTAEEARGTAITMGGTGAYLVPFAFDPTMIAIGVHNMNPYRRTAKVVEVVGASVWHALTATAISAIRGVENLVASEQGPTFAQPSFTPSTVKVQINMSEETAQDRPDISTELSVLIGEAKDNEEEASCAVGTGAATMLNVVGMAPPNGTAGCFTTQLTVASGGSTVAIADLYAVENALPVRHRQLAQWYMARSTIRKFQGFETTSGILFNAIQNFPGGASYAAVGNAANDHYGNTGLKLLGYPVNESPSVPIATGGNAPIATLANPEQFVIVDRLGMTIQFIPFVFSAGTTYVTGQTAIYASWRNAAGPLNADAGRVLRYQS